MMVANDEQGRARGDLFAGATLYYDRWTVGGEGFLSCVQKRD